MKQSEFSFGAPSAKRTPLAASYGNVKRLLASSEPASSPPAKRRQSRALLAPLASPLASRPLPLPALKSLPPPLPAPSPAPLYPSQWALDTPKSAWSATLSRLISSYKDKSGSGYAAATTNSLGCLLGQKGANRLENGYL